MSTIVTAQGSLFNWLSTEYQMIEWVIDRMKKRP